MSNELSPWWRRLAALAELAGDRHQQDIARTLGVSEAAVSGWRHGTPPGPENVKAAARAYGADALELMAIAYGLHEGETEKDGPKGQRATSARHAKAPTTSKRGRKASDIAARIPRTADVRKSQ